MINIGTILKQARKVKKLSQSKLSELSGISVTYISQIERGERNPSLGILESIAKPLEIPFPVLTFMMLEEKDIVEEKREAFKHIEPAVNALIREYFLK